jgi:hypothetical protein
MRGWSAVAPTRRVVGSLTGVPGDPRQNFREAVSDRDSGVRSRVETPARASEERGIAIMKLTTMTQITVDGVMQGNGPTDVDHGNGFERRTGTPRLCY